jgi:hypothetical protein
MTVSELVLDKVCMVRADLLVESLKVVCWWSCLPLDSVPDGRDVLLAGVIRFLVVVIIVAGNNCNPLRVPVLPLLAAFDVLLGTLGGDAKWRLSIAAGECFHAARDRERPGHLLVGGIRGGDVEQLLDGVPDDVGSACGIQAAHPWPPIKPDGAPGVLHASPIAMAGPRIKPKLAREPLLLWRVLRRPSTSPAIVDKPSNL